MTSVYDPVELAILWDRLISITNEVTSVLVRTAFSPVVRDSHDLSCVLFDAQGRSLAQGTHSIPAFIGTAPLTAQHMLARFPLAGLRPGDVLVTNDGWMGAGHTWDVNVMRPAFHKGRLAGLFMTITHLPDVGGRGFSAVAREIYEEGLRLPVCKLFHEGRLNEELIELVRSNVRIPTQVVGDLMANADATETGCRMLEGVLEDYRLDSLDTLADAIIGQSEQALRREIARVPDGTYRHEVQVEGFDQSVRLACSVTVAGERLSVDFAGTSGPVAAATNVPFCYTRSMALYAVKCLLLPTIPNNQGSISPIAISAPAGCILNVDPPAATGARAQIGHFVVPLIFGALAQALPQVPTEGGMSNTMNFQGIRPDGTPFSALYLSAGGLGAQRGFDGGAAISFPTNITGTQAEPWESATGMRVLWRELLPDSGGKGEFRGGLGQRIAMRNDSGQPIILSGMGVRTEHPAAGAEGGGAGSRCTYRINGRPVHPKGRHTLAPGDVLEVRNAGGGGWGDPQRRSSAQVEADLTAGYLTSEAAVRDYGHELLQSASRR